jgi:hypothetical protein
MTILEQNIQLCFEVCNEFKTQGYKLDIDPRTFKESYNLLKQPDGVWYKTTKQSLHEAPINEPIDFLKLPTLKKLTLLIDELDPDIKKNGGRIFISENLVYKIIKGTRYPIIFDQNEKAPARHQNLCDEFTALKLEKDRFRIEETYNLSKSSGGEWTISSSHQNHSGTKKILDLNSMPHLKALVTKINKCDPQFKSNGGRIFITPTRVYKVKNKIEIDYKL